DQSEIENSVGNWLRKTIAKLEQTRKASQLDSNEHPPAADSADMPGTPLFQTLHPKCANPHARRLFIGSPAANSSASGRTNSGK
ncbi:MAG: hypothetical protein WBQ31_15425, partial [Candidatus Acidiferrales bacterium]